ncbi:MAG: hypothetical protein P4N24_13755 [Acidobacteriota bacterium]|nr:hypothetical protein [Acidobacteriota bacterium]
MKLPHCDREQDVVEALRSGRWATPWGEEIRQHVAACAVCAEVALVAQEFQREEELAKAELEQSCARLPSAGLIWWKAQLAARRAAEQRAAEPIMLFARAAYFLGAFTALGLCVWQWPRIADWLRSVQILSPISRFLPMPDYSSSGELLYQFAQAWKDQTLTYPLAASAAAFLALMVFAAYVVWRED